MRFGRWTVVRQLPDRYHGQSLWECRCSCGTVRAVPYTSLVRGRSTSCGCAARDAAAARHADLAGQRYGRLLVISYDGAKKWRCLCDCGSYCHASGSHLRSGRITSCGCLRAARAAGMEAGRAIGRIVKQSLRVDGTSLDTIAPSREANRNNKTGIKGVCKLPGGRYRAYISLRGVHYHLGCYDTAAEAAQARASAEEELFTPILEAHKKKPRA